MKGRFPANLICENDVLDDGIIRKSGKNCIASKKGTFVDNPLFESGFEMTTYGDSGSYSRYFDLDAWWNYQMKKEQQQQVMCHYRLYHGDCLQVLSEIPFGNCVDLIVTDPPYGINFMQKNWDRAIPPVSVWKECLRVLKPGAFMFVLCTPRQDCVSRMIVNLQDAGFETGFSSIYWTYASGFPKATNLSKSVDQKAYAERTVVGKYQLPNGQEWNLTQDKGISENHVGGTFTSSGTRNLGITTPTTKIAQQLDGAYAGLNLKPAVEVILVAMKPIEKVTREQLYDVTGWDYWYTSARELKTKKQAQVLQKKYNLKKSPKLGKELIRRLALNPELDDEVWYGKKCLEYSPYKNSTFKTFLTQALVNGHGCTWLNDCRIPTSKKDAKAMERVNTPGSGRFRKDRWKTNVRRLGVFNKNDQMDTSRGRMPANLICESDILNDGITRKSGKMEKGVKRKNRKGYSGPMPERTGTETIGDSGSYSRYFDLDAWWSHQVAQLPPEVQRIFPFLAVTKPSKKEKGTFNTHNTVKPVKLMSHLITLGSRPGAIVLDPYVGSGTTGIAAKLLNRTFIGIELDLEYVRIAKRRIGKPVRLFVKKKQP